MRHSRVQSRRFTSHLSKAKAPQGMGTAPEAARAAGALRVGLLGCLCGARIGLGDPWGFLPGCSVIPGKLHPSRTGWEQEELWLPSPGSPRGAGAAFLSGCVPVQFNSKIPEKWASGSLSHTNSWGGGNPSLKHGKQLVDPKVSRFKDSGNKCFTSHLFPGRFGALRAPHSIGHQILRNIFSSISPPHPAAPAVP